MNAELDELRQIAYSGKDYLLKVQQRESEQTGIPSLKIGYNNVFGYYIEVRNVHKDKVPQEWIRKQTLVNAERYITQELKEYEEKILGAEDKILVLETQLYTELVQSLNEFIFRHSDLMRTDSASGLSAFLCHRGPRKQLYPSRNLRRRGAGNTPGTSSGHRKAASDRREVHSERCNAGQQHAADNHHYRSQYGG